MDSVPPLFASILDSARLRHVPRGQIIIYAGDDSSEISVLKNGLIKINDIDDQGNEKVLHILKPLAVLPLGFAGHKESDWFYTTLIDSDIYSLPRLQLEQAIESDPEVAAHLMRWSARETHELLVRLSSLGKSNTRDKLIAALKFLAVYHATERRSGWRRVVFPVSHQLLADMVGVTRESTTLAMKELQDEHIVRYPRLTILEIDFPKLVHL